MTWWQSFILGLIEGITEYLPVSSTGHLIVAQRMMGIGGGDDPAAAKAAADCFAICIQAGAIAAVLGIYWSRVRQILLGAVGKDAEGLKMIWAILAGFLPAAIIGFLANDWIEAQLFHFKWVVIAWIVGGVGILIVDRWMKKGGGSDGVDLAGITIRMALFIGFAQCIAMWPGTSRSLMTILGGILIGLRLAAAVEFSFLLGLVTLSAATVKKAVWPVHDIAPQYDTTFGGAMLMWNFYGPVPLLVGVVAATVSAAVAVKWMVSYLNRKGLGIFGWYRLAIGVAGLVLISINYAGINDR